MVAIFLCILGVLNISLLIVLGKQWRFLSRVGQVSLAGVVFLFLPVCWGMGAVLHDLNQMKDVSFCGSCHIMEPYLDSLHSNDADSLPAIHYQNNWAPQKTACYDCHTGYSMFGEVKAKLNGLKHVWVNYVGPQPEKIKLYSPYANRDCLRCHGPSKRFLESDGHSDDLADIRSGEMSCLDCHDTGHILPEKD